MRVYYIFKIVLVFLLLALSPAFGNVTEVLKHKKDANGGIFCSSLGDVRITVNYGGNVGYYLDWSVDGGTVTTVNTLLPPSGSMQRHIYLGRFGASLEKSSGDIVIVAQLYEILPGFVKGELLDTTTVTLTLQQDGTWSGGSCPSGSGWGIQAIYGNLYGGDKPPGEINLQINVQNIDAPGEVEVEIQSSDGGSLTVSATEGNTNHGNQIYTGEDGETLTFWGRAIYGNNVVGEFSPMVGTYSIPADNVVFNFSYALNAEQGGDTEEDGNLGLTVVNNSGSPAQYRVVDTATGETLASGSLQNGLNNINLPLGAVMSGKNIALEASSDGVTWSRLDSKSVPQADVYQDDFGLHIQYPSANLSGVFGNSTPPVPSPPPQPTPNPAPSPDETVTSSETESLATGESALQNVAVSDGGGIELEGGNIPEIPEIEPADDINIDLIFNKANELLSNTFVPKSLGKVVRLDFGKHEIFDRVMDFSIPIPSWVDFFRRILHIILLYIFAVKTFYLFFRDGL